MKTVKSKVYVHQTGYMLVWCKALKQYYLAKRLGSGKIKKRFVGGYSYNPSWRQAAAEIRRSVKIPVHGWEKKYLKYDNSVEAFDNALKMAV